MELLLIYKKEELRNNTYYLFEGLAPCIKEDNEYKLLTNKFECERVNIIDENNIDDYQGMYLSLEELFEMYDVSSIEELLVKSNDDIGNIYKIIDDKLEEVYEIEYIKDKICDKIVSQDKEVEELLSVVFNNIIIKDYSNEKYELLRKNALLLGPTGVGKTKIIKELEANLNMPMSYIDIGRMNEKEFIGKIVNDLIIASDGDLEKAEHGIVVIDNLEENREDIRMSDENVATSGIINFDFLLRPSILSVEIEDELYDFDTSKLTMIFILNSSEKDKNDTLYNRVGFNNHTSLEDLLSSKGISRKGLYSITNIICLNNLEKEDYKEILLNSSISPLITKIRELCDLGVTITINDDFIDYLAEQAYQKDEGVYGLINIINELFKGYDYSILNNQIEDLDFRNVQRVRKIDF